MFESIQNFLEQYPNSAIGIKIFALFIGALIIDLIVRHVFIKAIKRITDKTKNTWDDKLYENKVFNKIANLIPAIVIYNFSYLFLEAEEIVSRIVLAYMIYAGVVFFNAFLESANTIYNSYDFAKDKPIKGYIQIIKLIVYIIGILIIISVLINKSPVLLLSGIGAMMAVILLIFKDTILSLVASIQLRTNNMIKIGDWITMPKYNADGDVIDIALHTVKVQNFDKTITTIPTHKLIEESFQNWKGMVDSKGRRIMRSVNIDMNSVKFLSDEEINKFKNFKYLKDYIEAKEKEISEFNSNFPDELKNDVNQRKLTNVGTFRAYLKHYLKDHPKINTDFIFLIRQLQPGSEGLPIQVYVFTNENKWVAYEEIQADIFDHILAIVPEFELRLFQNPTGNDFARGLSK
ncbi:MAG: mechanosensitive ion channel family protein [Candidatus Delongbacteria bacterium]|jgi:miniconductance mechanosensitive channel|nr:mechanosensitive ion channel family protein [Candidatus Delongbacteria bacterium]